jgi:hypothetical protein
MLRALALLLILQLLDRIVNRADAALTIESKGESVTPFLKINGIAATRSPSSF